MITRREYIDCYWNDYMGHERRFLNLRNYVALRLQNLQTCSDEIISQLILVCTGFEASMKALYEFSRSCPNIKDYLEKLDSDGVFNSNMDVCLLEGSIVKPIQPFYRAEPGDHLKWWDAYNEIKHNRVNGYEQGTLENLISALAALYYINMLHAKKVGNYWQEFFAGRDTDDAADVPNDVSRLFRLGNWEARETVFAHDAFVLTNGGIDEIWSNA